MKIKMKNLFTGKVDEVNSTQFETKTCDFRIVTIGENKDFYGIQQKFYVPKVNESDFCEPYRDDKNGKIKRSEIDLDLSEPFMDMHIIPYYLPRVEEWRFLPEVRLGDI